jgi:hypothetical protein
MPLRFSCVLDNVQILPAPPTSLNTCRAATATSRMTGSRIAAARVRREPRHADEPDHTGKDEDENRPQTHTDELPHEVDVVDRARHQITRGVFREKTGTLML